MLKLSSFKVMFCISDLFSTPTLALKPDLFLFLYWNHQRFYKLFVLPWKFMFL